MASLEYTYLHPASGMRDARAFILVVVTAICMVLRLASPPTVPNEPLVEGV